MIQDQACFPVGARSKLLCCEAAKADMFFQICDGSTVDVYKRQGNGLSDEISAKADDLIRIPMCGQVESLNAAISTAVIAYEVLRQRSTGKK